MKNYKKIISMLLAFVLIFSTMSVGLTAFAADPMTFTVSSVKKAKIGQTVTIKVTVKNSKEVCAVNPTVIYDASKLEFVSAENGDVFLKNAFKAGGAHEGKVRILYDNGVVNTKKDGTIATLKFKVLKDAEGYAEITLDCPKGSVVDAKEKALDVNVVSGNVAIISPIIYAGEAKAENAIDGKYYQKVPFFSSYKSQSVELIAGMIGNTVKSVEWSVDTNRLTLEEKVTEDGKKVVVVRPNRYWYCRANVTAKITDKDGDVYEKTVMVEFFKLEFTKRLPVF